jgi:hypothetical protein
MSEIINVRQLAPGVRVGLSGGATAEIVSNPGDGIWIVARYLSSPDDVSLVGTEEMIFAQEVVAIHDAT